MTVQASVRTDLGNTRVMSLVREEASTYRADSTGDWNSSSTWREGSVPTTDGDTVIIDSGVTVTLTHQEATRYDWIRVDGTLKFDPSVSTKLNVSTLVTSNESRLEIGTDTNPIQSGVTAEIQIIDNGKIQKSDDVWLVGRGIITHGQVEIVGQQKTTWTTLAQDPQKGDTSFELSSAPTGWESGDRIVTPGLTAYQTSDATTDANGNVTSFDHQDEIRTIDSISSTTVNFTNSLDHDHIPPETHLDTYVAMLSRNVEFYSESTEQFRRGHFMHMAGANLDIVNVKYCKMTDFGRTDKAYDVTAPQWYRNDNGTKAEARSESPAGNYRGRYSLHFHINGNITSDETRWHTVKGVSIERNPGAGIVVHHSAADVRDCVTYDCKGTGIFFERGTEVAKCIGNFCLRSFGSGENTESRAGWNPQHPNRFFTPPQNVDDFAHSGHGIWSESPTVAVEDNVCAGHRHLPIEFWTRQLHEEILQGDNYGPNADESLDDKHDMFPQTPKDVLSTYNANTPSGSKDEAAVGTPGDKDPPVGDSWHTKDSSVYFGQSLPLRSFKNNVAFGCGGPFDIWGPMFRNDSAEFNRYVHSGNIIYNVGPLILEDGTEHLRSNYTSSGNVGLDHRHASMAQAENYELYGPGTTTDSVGVFKNHAYIGHWHVKNSTIKNWGTGVITPDYGGTPNFCELENNTFSQNNIDVKIPGQQGGRNGGPVIMEGNTYSGNTDIYYEEIAESKAIPERFVRKVGEAHSQVRYEGQTLYHGWCDPNFVFVEEGDDQRLNEVLNHGNHDRWKNQILDGDDPDKVLPGLTHQELYDQYDAVYYGGMRDPAASDSETPASFDGSGGTYDSTPFLGPANKTQPTDEIWIDLANNGTFTANNASYSVIDYGDGVANEEPIRLAEDDRVVQLNRPRDRANDEPNVCAWAEYTFEIDPGGDYMVYIRAQMGEDPGGFGSFDANKRLHVRMDGGSWNLYAPQDSTNTWSLNDLVFPPLRRDDGFVRFNGLNKGQHKITISGTGSGMRIDKVLIKEATCGGIPYGIGKPHTSHSGDHIVTMEETASTTDSTPKTK